jgi:hypothetical protein
MSTRRTPRVPPAPSVADQLASLKAKFQRLAEIRAQLTSLKSLYQQHDALMTELLPLFITKTDSQFIIQREITLGNKNYKLVPHFYDQKKGTILAKQWKSSAFETASIE